MNKQTIRRAKTKAAAKEKAELTKILEELFIILEDIKKEFVYDKSTGRWSWYDRSEGNSLAVLHGEFKTRLEAMFDAAEPYLNELPNYPALSQIIGI